MCNNQDSTIFPRIHDELTCSTYVNGGDSSPTKKRPGLSAAYSLNAVPTSSAAATNSAEILLDEDEPPNVAIKDDIGNVREVVKWEMDCTLKVKEWVAVYLL